MADSGTTVTIFVPQSSTTPPVPAPRPHLPYTGFDLLPALMIAALLLAIGSLLVALGHRPVLHPFRRT